MKTPHVDQDGDHHQRDQHAPGEADELRRGFEHADGGGEGADVVERTHAEDQVGHLEDGQQHGSGEQHDANDGGRSLLRRRVIVEETFRQEDDGDDDESQYDDDGESNRTKPPFRGGRPLFDDFGRIHSRPADFVRVDEFMIAVRV